MKKSGLLANRLCLVLMITALFELQPAARAQKEESKADFAATSTRPNLVVQLGHSGYTYAIALSPDGKYVLTGSGDNTARLWEADTGREVHTFEGHSKDVNSVAFSPPLASRIVIDRSLSPRHKLSPLGSTTDD